MIDFKSLRKLNLITKYTSAFFQISVFRKSAWHYKASRDQYYLHQFGSAQPDLNYRNPVVVEEMKVSKFLQQRG